MRKVSENNSVHEIGLHLVFCTKYRKRIFTDVVEMELKHILSQTCAEYEWSLEALEIMPDHVHIFIQCGPKDRPNEIARTLKSISAVCLFTRFPELKGRKFWGSGLWSTGTFYGSVGSVNAETIREYIENQKSTGDSSHRTSLAP
jgi:putative transposase